MHSTNGRLDLLIFGNNHKKEVSLKNVQFIVNDKELKLSIVQTLLFINTDILF